MVPDRRLLAAAAILGFLGVALGAFGAHALNLADKPLEWWRTAGQYHQLHAVAALLAALLGVPRAGWLFVAGTVVFSGSLYVMALTHVTILGAITPLGGLLYLIGWGLLAYAAIKSPAAAK